MRKACVPPSISNLASLVPFVFSSDASRIVDIVNPDLRALFSISTLLLILRFHGLEDPLSKMTFSRLKTLTPGPKSLKFSKQTTICLSVQQITLKKERRIYLCVDIDFRVCYANLCYCHV